MSRNRPTRVPAPVERALDAGLDRALEIQRPVVLNYLDRTRRRHPGMTPAQLVRQLERRYLAAVWASAERPARRPRCRGPGPP
jgi:hypothetical protein